MNTLTSRPSTALQAAQLDYFLVDGSGSMMSKWWDLMAALDGFSDVLKAQNIASHGIVTVFEGQHLNSTQRDSVIGEWPTFSASPLVSQWGGTPLFDAINLMGRELRDLQPRNCSIVIVTDGDENGSTHTNATQARAILDWCRAQSWQVTFLGADFNNSRQARLLGMDECNSLGVQKTKLLEAGRVLGRKRVANAITGADINFTSDEKSTFGGYLTDDSGSK
jgi:hypothetical protein